MDSKGSDIQVVSRESVYKGSFLKFALPTAKPVILGNEIPEHTVGIEFVLET